MNVEGKRGGSKKRWLDTIENNTRAIGVSVGDVENRDEWRLRCQTQVVKRKAKKKKKRTEM
jgi:hypothetical protein